MLNIFNPCLLFSSSHLNSLLTKLLLMIFTHLHICVYCLPFCGRGWLRRPWDYPANCLKRNCLLGGNMARGNLSLCTYRLNAFTIFFFLNWLQIPRYNLPVSCLWLSKTSVTFKPHKGDDLESWRIQICLCCPCSNKQYTKHSFFKKFEVSCILGWD